MRSVTAAFGVFSVLLLGSSSQAQVLTLPKAEVEYDHDADFHAFHFFRWKDTQERLSDPARHMAMVTAIERELERKGLKKSIDGAADVQVRFYASVEKHIRGSGRQANDPWTHDLRTSIDLEKMAEGTLVIELYQAGGDQRVWRGTTSRVFRPGSLDESAIRSAVALVLRAYPPAPKP
jgi:hypothetical protein